MVAPLPRADNVKAAAGPSHWQLAAGDLDRDAFALHDVAQFRESGE
jgi:hypothetical protein